MWITLGVLEEIRDKKAAAGKKNGINFRHKKRVLKNKKTKELMKALSLVIATDIHPADDPNEHLQRWRILS